MLKPGFIKTVVVSRISIICVVRKLVFPSVHKMMLILLEYKYLYCII